MSLVTFDCALRPRNINRFIAVASIAILGTEGIRRTDEWKNGVTLHYLNWEFWMIVVGFVVAHLLIGTTIRWLGWELRTEVANMVTKKGQTALR